MRNTAKAFTRIELLAVVAAIGLLSLAVLPVLAMNKSDAQRLACFNNLRLVGRGVQMWAGDHNQQLPWRTSSSDGGEFVSTSRPGAAWVEHYFLSNEIVTPKILACPSDAGVRRAAEWQQFVSMSFRANAISYSLSLDGSVDAPRTWLSADRNFRAQSATSGCSTNVNNVHAIPTFVPISTPVAEWTNGVVHGTSGHVLTTDGSVEFTSIARLKDLMLRPDVDDGGATHFLRAR